MKNKTLLGAVLLISGILIACISGYFILLAMLPYTPDPSNHRHGIESSVSHSYDVAIWLTLAPPPFLAGLGMVAAGIRLIRHDRVHRQEQALWRLLGGILSAAGVLIAGAFGLCTLVAGVAGGSDMGAFAMIFSFLPFAAGIGLFYLGRILGQPPAVS